MKRVVITGLGIVSSIGNDKNEVKDSLWNCTSGIEFCEDYKALGFRSHIHGSINLDISQHVPRKNLRFMGEGAAYSYISLKQAAEDANLKESHISNERTGIIIGSGGVSTHNLTTAAETVKEKGARKLLPYMVPRTMASTHSANLATSFAIKGVNYSITSACSTSTHCVGNAYEIIQMGKQDIIFAGGGEELHWTTSVLFDAMLALSSKYNDTPTLASRPFDKDSDGFIISGGAGIVVLEELEHALARNAKIYAEVVGYGYNSDGFDIVQPSGEGALRCMHMALKNTDTTPCYINTHGTSTPVGDPIELNALKKCFGENIPHFNSTKSLTGHSLGATGVHEVIYSLIMMENNFISATKNVQNPINEAENLPLVTERIDNIKLNSILSNSFGFGGTNACLLLQKPQS